MAHSVDVETKEERFGDKKKELEEALEKALQFLDKSHVQVEVSLVSDEDMAEVNKETRNKEGPTTVLSFEEPEEVPRADDEPVRLGEIYLAPDTIEREGKDIIFLAIHGLLHLLGYTHEAESDTIKMEELEDEIWQTLSQD